MFDCFSSFKAFISKALKQQKHNQKVFGFFLILFGLLLLVVPFAWKRVYRKPQPEPEIFERAEKTTLVSASLPSRIIIPKVGVDLPVRKAEVEDNNWELFEDAASFLVTSAKVGQEGNTVVYAHAKPHLFGPLKKIKKGERIYLLTDSGWAVYEVENTQIVFATSIEVVLPTEEKTLTLYTCTNFLDKDRFVVFAKLVALNPN